MVCASSRVGPRARAVPGTIVAVTDPTERPASAAAALLAHPRRVASRLTGGRSAAPHDRATRAPGTGVGRRAYPRRGAALPVGPLAPPPLDEPAERLADPVRDPDGLTRDLLVRAAEGLGPGVRVLDFRRRWWDGDAWVPLLTVRVAGRPAWLVESAGDLHVLPARAPLARTLLRRGRRLLDGLPLARPGTRRRGSIAVGAETPATVLLLDGGPSAAQRRETTWARRQGRRKAEALAAVVDGAGPDQLELFDEATAGGEAPVTPLPDLDPRDDAVATVRVVQGADVLPCPRGCGALVPLPPPGTAEDDDGACPVCSRA